MKDVTLVFLRRGGNILLAMKKRGFGEGKWNGPGGKVEVGETIEAAAVRECQEEISVTPQALQQVGTLDFYMSADPAFGHRAHIFTAIAWDGEPTESDEMRPQWFADDAIPYDTMWADDILWLPFLLADTYFTGSVTIGPDDTVLTSAITPLAK